MRPSGWRCHAGSQEQTSEGDHSFVASFSIQDNSLQANMEKKSCLVLESRADGGMVGDTHLELVHVGHAHGCRWDCEAAVRAPEG